MFKIMALVLLLANGLPVGEPETIWSRKAYDTKEACQVDIDSGDADKSFREFLTRVIGDPNKVAYILQCELAEQPAPSPDSDDDDEDDDSDHDH